MKPTKGAEARAQPKQGTKAKAGHQEQGEEDFIDPYANPDVLQMDYEEMLLRQHNEKKGLVPKRENTTIITTKTAYIQEQTTTPILDRALNSYTQDMLRIDRNGRTVLHRAALEQNIKLINELCKDAKEKMPDYVAKFIDLKDRFGSTPLLNACTANNEASGSKRGKCVDVLLSFGANPNVRSDVTLWTPLTWCVYYEDSVSVKSLLEHKAYAFWPDYRGLYPLDYIGLKKKKKNKKNIQIAKDLIVKLKEVLLEFENSKANQEILLSKYGESDQLRFLQFPLLRSSILYWAMFFALDKKEFIIPLLDVEHAYPEMPLFCPSLRNCYHACCSSGNTEALKILFEPELMQKRYEKIHQRIKKAEEAKEELKYSLNFEFTKEERKKKMYRKNFMAYVQGIPKWVSEFEGKVEKYIQARRKNILPFYIGQDEQGNTPLHLASAQGHFEAVKFLLSKNVNKAIENSEGWRCEELVQHDSVKKAYKDHKETPPEESGGSLLARLLQRNIKKTATVHQDVLDKLFEEKERMIPDVVLVFKVQQSHDVKRSDAIMNRVNFNISLIQSSFQCYMAPALDDTLYYLMIKMKEQQLDKECADNEMKMKLREEYLYQTFDLKRKADFEPFRSRQRQEITLTALNRLVDLEQLDDLNVLDDVYRMHTISGLKKIESQWSWNKKKIFPEPLPNLPDYFKEGQNLSFIPVTALKVYFGEKYSFYFAWMSFYICYLPFLAIPGLIVFVLTRTHPGTNNVALPIWVTYNSLVVTLLVERWKRKSAEIATRWGTIDQGNDNQDKKVRKEYSGDEVISTATGTLTKFNPRRHFWRYNFVSVSVLCVLLAGVVVSFVLIQKMKEAHPHWNAFQKTLVSAINGVAISFANYFYERVARYFVDKENHKFHEDYEKSLILRIAISKMLNSAIGVFYLTFIEQESLDDQFYTLLSLLIVQQITTTLLTIIIPWSLFRVNKLAYFAKLTRKIVEQDKFRKTEEGTAAYKAPVLNCRTGKLSKTQWEMNQVELNSIRIEKEDILDYYGDVLIQFGYITMFSPAFSLGPMIALIANLFDIRAKIWAILRFYKRPEAEKVGGIGNWLPAWEIVSIISIFVNALSLFWNLDFTLNFLETLFRDDSGDAYVDPGPDYNIYRLWVFVIIVHAILIIKFLVSALINDRPRWVVKQEEKQEYEEELAIDKKMDMESKLRSQNSQKKSIREPNKKPTMRAIGQTNANIADPSSVKEANKKAKPPSNNPSLVEIDHQANQRKQAEKEKEIAKEKEKEIKKMKEEKAVENPPKENHLGKLFKKKEQQPTDEKDSAPLNPANLKLARVIKPTLFNTFVLIEKELLTARLSDANFLTDNIYVMCNHCHKTMSEYNCLSCQEQFCGVCYKQVHNKIVLTSHEVVSLDQLNLETRKTKQAVAMKTGLGALTNAIGEAQDPARLVTGNAWRKFEIFNFPLTNTSTSFYRLKMIYANLVKLYITDNGILKGNEIESLSKPLKYIKNKNELLQNSQNSQNSGDVLVPVAKHGLLEHQDKDLQGNLDLSCEQGVQQFVGFEMFNIEEKLLMNKIAFLEFKRRGAGATFDEFLKKLKILEEGSLESKLFLFFDLVDHDDDGFVSKDELFDLLKWSFMQTLTSDEMLHTVIAESFNNYSQINKKDVFQIVLKNAKIMDLFAAFTQTDKAHLPH